MPVIIWWIGGAILALFGGGLILKFSKKDVAKITKGKKVLFLGLHATGKSTLLHVLAKGTIPETSGITGGKKIVTPKMGAEILQLDLLQTDEIPDFPGAIPTNLGEFRGQWVKELESVDIIFYLFNIMSLYSHDRNYELEDIHAEIDTIKEHVNAANKKQPFLFLIGSHADLHPERKSFEVIRDEIKASDFGQNVLRKIRGIESDNIRNLHNELFMAGQLNLIESASELAGQVINLYIRHNTQAKK